MESTGKCYLATMCSKRNKIGDGGILAGGEACFERVGCIGFSDFDGEGISSHEKN